MASDRLRRIVTTLVGDDSDALTAEQAFRLLANRRRRRVIEVLLEASEPLTLNELVEAVTETEQTNAAPTASIDGLRDRSNPRWDRFEVDWAASDGDGNLGTVVVEMRDSKGRVLDSVTSRVSGSSASGVDEVRSKRNAADIVVTVSDTDGATDSAAQSI